MKRLNRRKSLLYALAASGIAGAASLAYATGIEPRWIEVVRLPVEMPRLAPQFDGYRIAQISDLHLGEWTTAAQLRAVVSMVNAEEPDIIAITGDYVTRVYDDLAAELVPVLNDLRARDGVVWVLGNHDYWGGKGAGPVRYALEHCGLIDLNNKVHTLERDGAQLHVAGVDSARELMSRLDKVMEALPEEGAAILLAHEPDFADESAATGRFDLQLSGHSHGGQVAIPFLGPPRLPLLGRKYPEGLYKVGGMTLYTNRGIGTVGLPVRFFARPEITVLTLVAGS
ncbi:MAG TPA: metallophosphoesterase [Chloroflexia bacterium]|nr:metallophosphoesterase [Chloroflexia bacterium]